MCIAIYHPYKAAPLTYGTLFNCAMNNPDGMGIAWTTGKRMHVRRYVDNYQDFNELWKTYKAARNAQADMILHFRLATHGRTNKANTHPFKLRDGTYFAHNGILSGWGNKKVSDTVMFARTVLDELVTIKGWLENVGILELLETQAAGDKFVFFRPDKYIEIINHELGIWDDSTWFSNSSYKTYRLGTYTEKSYSTWAEAWDRARSWRKKDKTPKTPATVYDDEDRWNNEVEYFKDGSYFEPPFEDDEGFKYCGSCAPVRSWHCGVKNNSAWCKVCGCSLGYVRVDQIKQLEADAQSFRESLSDEERIAIREIHKGRNDKNPPF